MGARDWGRRRDSVSNGDSGENEKVLQMVEVMVHNSVNAPQAAELDTYNG